MFNIDKKIKRMLGKEKSKPISVTPIKQVAIDKKKVMFFNNKPTPPLNFIKKTYRKIHDDKAVPIMFMTREQYLNKYIDNQEKKKKIDFPPTQEQAYIDKEMPEYNNILSRYTTKKNPYFPPATVFFNDSPISNKQFEQLAFHEYGHEKVERNKLKFPTDYKEEIYCDRVAKQKIQYDRTSKNASLKDAKYLSLYHGTAKEYLPSIMEKGLVPQYNPSMYVLEKQPRISLSGSVRVAKGQARFGGEAQMIKERQKLVKQNPDIRLTEEFYEENLYKEPAVLKVTVPAEKVKGHIYRTERQKEKYPGIEDYEGAKLMEKYEVTYPDVIPPENIKVMKEEEIIPKMYRQMFRSEQQAAEEFMRHDKDTKTKEGKKFWDDAHIKRREIKARRGDVFEDKDLERMDIYDNLEEDDESQNFGVSIMPKSKIRVVKKEGPITKYKYGKDVEGIIIPYEACCTK